MLAYMIGFFRDLPVTAVTEEGLGRRGIESRQKQEEKGGEKNR